MKHIFTFLYIGRKSFLKRQKVFSYDDMNIRDDTENCRWSFLIRKYLKTKANNFLIKKDFLPPTLLMKKQCR